MSSNDMADLEERQDQLLEKLDKLYERIKKISLYCSPKEKAIQQECKDFKITELVWYYTSHNMYLNKGLVKITHFHFTLSRYIFTFHIH